MGLYETAWDTDTIGDIVRQYETLWDIMDAMGLYETAWETVTIGDHMRHYETLWDSMRH